MKTYITIKQVSAEPMTAAEAHNRGYRIGQARPEDVGYVVVYKDGYASWSPKQVFDEAAIDISYDSEMWWRQREILDQFKNEQPSKIDTIFLILATIISSGSVPWLVNHALLKLLDVRNWAKLAL